MPGGEATGSLTDAWQYAMMVIATLCFIIFLLCFLLTKEHVKSLSTVSVAKDFRSLLTNVP